MSDYRFLLQQTDPAVYAALIGEEQRQCNGIELIPSENYTYPEVLELLGSVFTNKYSEGYPGKRYYGGQEFTDAVEKIAVERAKILFRAEHANVQPLSGSAMNQAVYLALLEPGDTILAMDLSHGGHLTHGSPLSHMGRIFNFVRYKTHPETGAINYGELRELAVKHCPRMLLCGHSSYPRELDYSQFKAIADEVGAITVADLSHIAALVAANVMANPLDVGFDVMTLTTHKSLRGPRGGLILCCKHLATAIDKSVFPGLQGGPHMNQIAAVAVTLGKALRPDFASYARQVRRNASVLAEALVSGGCKLVTGGTDNHLLVLDTMKSFGINGLEAQELLDRVGMTTNKQVIPDDPLPPARPSGLRLGSPAATTRGMSETDMEAIADWVVETLRFRADKHKLGLIASAVLAHCRKFPVPGIG